MEVKMAYSLRSEERDGYLYFHVEGETSYETGEALWREIGSKCQELGYKRIIVEEDLKGQVTDTEMFRIASRFPDFGLLRVRIAFIDRHPDHDHGNEFGQLVCSNRGITSRICHSVLEAEEWIAS